MEITTESYMSFGNPFMALNYEKSLDNSSIETFYTIGCKWSHQGECLMVPRSDNLIHFFNLPENVKNCDFSDEYWITQGWQDDAIPHSVISVENIYDYHWIQNVDLRFGVSCRGFPLHFYDVESGKIFASYIFHNHLDEQTSAHSFDVSLDGTKVICGYAKSIRIFQVERPGRISSNVSRKEQCGIISTISHHPVLPNIFATGSYSNSVGLYSLETNGPIAIFHGHNKGVTHIKFSEDGTKLFSGTRKDSEIICWDIRNPGKVLSAFDRGQTTNQKMYFDITEDSRYLITGTTSGNVLVWDLDESISNGTVEPNFTFKAHNDSVNGVSVNSKFPILATSCGQRHRGFEQLGEATDSDSDSESDTLSTDSDSEKRIEKPESVKIKNIENSAKLWSLLGR